MDHADAEDLRVVHGRVARRRGKGRHQRARDAHLHHAILPQVRPQDNNAGMSWLDRALRQQFHIGCTTSQNQPVMRLRSSFSEVQSVDENRDRSGDESQ